MSLTLVGFLNLIVAMIDHIMDRPLELRIIDHAILVYLQVKESGI